MRDKIHVNDICSEQSENKCSNRPKKLSSDQEKAKNKTHKLHGIRLSDQNHLMWKGPFQCI